MLLLLLLLLLLESSSEEEESSSSSFVFAATTSTARVPPAKSVDSPSIAPRCSLPTIVPSASCTSSVPARHTATKVACSPLFMSTSPGCNARTAPLATSRAACSRVSPQNCAETRCVFAISLSASSREMSERSGVLVEVWDFACCCCCCVDDERGNVRRCAADKPKGNGMEYNGSVQDHLQERFRVWVNLDSYRNPGFGFGGLRVHTPNT